MLSLVLGAICFSGIHLGVAGTPLRDRAIAALGEDVYRAVFSIVSLAAIVWLVMAYKDAPYVATWGILEWWKPIAMILMLPAVFLAVIGLTTPNPTSIGQEGRVAATLTSSACPRFRRFGPRPTRSRRTCPCRKSNSNIRADLRNRRPMPHSTWHLDEVYLKIDGRFIFLWRARGRSPRVQKIR